jgi:beta-glucosidase
MAWPSGPQLDATLMFKDTETVTEMGCYFGYREYDRQKYIAGNPVDLVFPFGYGISYSKFDYANLSVPCTGAVGPDAIFEVSVDISNTEGPAGDEVAMLFVKPPPKPPGITGDRPWKELKSFARVSVPAGQTVTAKLPLRIRDLRYWEGDHTGRWVIDSGEYTIAVGKNAEDAETSGLQATVTVNGY